MKMNKIYTDTKLKARDKKEFKNFKFTLIMFLFFMLSVLFVFQGCAKKSLKKYEQSQFLFGTYIKIVVYSEDESLAKKAFKVGFDEIERIDKSFNSKVKDSVIDKINRADIKEIPLDEEAQFILSKVKEGWLLSLGQYDVTLGPLMKLWGFTEDIDESKLKVPTKVEIDKTLEKIDYGKVKIVNNILSFEEPIQEIDTGSFLKGYALYKARNKIEDLGIKHALLSSISSLEIIGTKPDNVPWVIGVENPENPENFSVVLSLKDVSAGISGSYQTYVIIDGKKYHHILNKKTGYPIEDIEMVVVITDDGLEADIYSTAFFTMPIDDVIEYVNSRENMEVLIIDKHMKHIMSKNFSQYIKLN